MKPQAIIIGAGFTGVATAHDLALRGFDITVVDRGPIVNGTSGRTHGLLHSGARYAVNDKEAAIECIEENLLLRKLLPEVIEPNGGMFIGLTEEDQAYGEKFAPACEEAGIEIHQISPKKALELEPNLNPNLLTAYLVPDATFDPLRLALAFAATAKANGAKFNFYHEVTGLVVDGQGNVAGVKFWDRTTDQRGELRADIVINATGAWAGEITAMGGAHVPISPTPGVMVAYDKRLVERAINRLTKPSDGDIALPQRRMLVVGTTSFSAENLDYIPVVEDQVKLMLEKGAEMIPGLRQTKERGAYMATRPLIGASAPGRSISRTFKCYDHKETDNVGGFITITGGKATTLRQMAEKTADVVCQQMGITASCRTKDVKLLSYRKYYM